MKKVLGSIAIAAGLTIGASVVHADMHPGIQGLNDLLIQKGIITKEEVDAQAKKHSFNITGYVQFQGKINQNEDRSPNDGFTVRRAKLSAFGYAYEHINFKLEANFVGVSGSPSSLSLDDAYIEDNHLPYLVGRAGQFKVPFSLEELTSDTEILSIERSEVVKQIAPGRDQGISFSGNIPGIPVSYGIGAFNGQKTPAGTTYGIGANEDAAKNKANDNDQLLYAARITAKPLEWISIGISGLTSKDGGVGTTLAVDRNAYEVELQIKSPKRGCSLQGEYLRQWLKNSSDATTTSDGFYVQAGHYIMPKHLEAVIKYEEYDSDKDTANKDDIRWTTVGLNFYIYGNDAKLMANYIFKDEKQQDYNNNTFLTQLQLRF